MVRDDLILVFLARHGYARGDMQLLVRDASFRRYFRIRGARLAVPMDAPPPEDVLPSPRIAARPELNAAAFLAAFTACAAQLHVRIARRRVTLAIGNAQPQYLNNGSRTWRLLEDALSQPAAKPLAVSLDRWIQAGRRGNILGLEP